MTGRFDAVLENKPFILNVYHSVSREQIESYLYQLTYGLLEGVVKEQSKDTLLSEDEMSITLHGNIANAV